MDFIKSLCFISNNFFLLMLGLVGVGFLIGFHELGHFLFCKIFRVHTPSFSIGFGPTLIERKIGDTQFKLSAIPLGGYVEIAGMAEVAQGEQQEAFRHDQYSFIAKPWYQKFLIMMGGILFNLIFAYAVFISLFALNMPRTATFYPFNATTTVESVEAGSTAQTAGLVPGDTIVQVNGQAVPDALAIIKTFRTLPQQQVTLSVMRQDQIHDVTFTVPEKTIVGSLVGNPEFKLASSALPRYPFMQAVKYGIACTHAFIKMTIKGFKHLFTAEGRSAVGGPVMIIAAISQGASKGAEVLFFILALISINLAILNLLPLPIFDGGQIVFYTIEAIIGRSLPHRVREYIHIASWLCVIVLVVLITVRDITRIARPYCDKIRTLISKK